MYMCVYGFGRNFIRFDLERKNSSSDLTKVGNRAIRAVLSSGSALEKIGPKTPALPSSEISQKSLPYYTLNAELAPRVVIGRRAEFSSVTSSRHAQKSFSFDFFTL